MVSKKEVDKQLEKIGFKAHGWGRGEVSELPNIILPDEEIYECVNGIYDGGFALLIATDIRVLLVDKKPLNYLTVEDMRFDMISEMDYSHRLLGARISISAGDKNLKFLSYNQQRLRKLIGHVQHCMAEVKKRQSTHQEGQVQHLEKINQQLQAYLIAQHQYQTQLQQAQQNGAGQIPEPAPLKPSPELSDFLFAQSLLAQYQGETGNTEMPLEPDFLEKLKQDGNLEAQAKEKDSDQPPPSQPVAAAEDSQNLYEAAVREIFGKRHETQTQAQPAGRSPLDVNPIHIAYSKLPMALRNRKFGRPSFHAHSAQEAMPAQRQPAGPIAS